MNTTGGERPATRSPVYRSLPLQSVLLGSLILTSCGGDAGPGQIASPDPAEVTLRVRVHLLSSDFALLNTELTEEETAVIFGRVNKIWRQAQISWQVESIIREEALNAEGFAAMLSGEIPVSGDVIASVLPRDHKLAGGWDAFLILSLGGIAGGIYFPGVPAALSAELDPQGRRELVGATARILAHELGHSLSLPHVPCTPAGNLMSPGCPAAGRTRMSEAQVAAARRQALTGRPFGGEGVVD